MVRAHAGGDGARVVDRGCGGDPACGGARTKDRPARCAAHFAVAAGRTVSATVGAQRGDARCAAVVAAPAEVGGAAHAGEEPVAAPGTEPGRAAEAAVVEPRGPRGAGAVATGRLDGTTARRVA